MKLSETQKLTIQHIRNGYEVGFYNGFNAHVSLQHGGCGRGGKTAKITIATFFALKDKNIIEQQPNQEISRPVRYQLTSFGKTIEL